MQESPRKRKFSDAGWVKRFGVAGFLFFLIKGLLWLIIPALAAYFAW
ncbi:MAG: alanyl-tRNA synthetase [Acidobacteria bacterium]|nr:alanyl-tRNA synthetase [Acidobacteriota bacterium]